MNMSNEPNATEAAKGFRPILTLGQVLFLARSPGIILLLFTFLVHVKYDYVKTMWETELGIMMLVVATAHLVVGELALALLFVLQNLCVYPHSKWRILFSRGESLVILIICGAPAMFILLVGPATIQIIEGLTK